MNGWTKHFQPHYITTIIIVAMALFYLILSISNFM